MNYNRPFPRLRSLRCLAQRSFPLFVGVVPNALLRKDCVSHFELSIRFAIEAFASPVRSSSCTADLQIGQRRGLGNGLSLFNGSRLAAASEDVSHSMGYSDVLRQRWRDQLTLPRFKVAVWR